MPQKQTLSEQSVNQLVRVMLKSVPPLAFTMERQSDHALSAPDARGTLCAFCVDSVTHHFSSFPCLKGTCTEHVLEGMTEIYPVENAVHTDTSVRGTFLMCVEVKTATTEQRVQEEIILAQIHGRVCFFFIFQQTELFKKVIPKSVHRVQCIQHCIALTAHLVLYVVADAGVRGIIRTVLLLVPDSFKTPYIDIFDTMVAEHLPWVHGSLRTELPQLSQQQLGYLQSNDVLKFHLLLWVVPKMISIWNLVKNSGDLYSRLLNNAKPQHMKLPPRVKIGLRGLYSMFYQIYQTERIWATLKILADRRFTITTYSKLRTAVTNNMPSFRNICRQIAASIQMDMFCFIHATDPTIPQVLTPTTPTESARQVEKTHESFTYRKAECFVKSETLTSKRLDKSLSHPCVTVEGFRARCILCCCHCTFGDGKLRERSERHPRLGHVQRFECGSCKVALCRKPRFLWMGKLESCFSLFHTVSKEELAVLAQNLCAIQNPADTPFDTMVVRAPEKVARQSALSLKMKDSWKARKTCAAEGCDMQSYDMAGLPP